MTVKAECHDNNNRNGPLRLSALSSSKFIIHFRYIFPV